MNAHHARIEDAPRMSRSDVRTGMAVGAIIATVISTHAARANRTFACPAWPPRCSQISSTQQPANAAPKYGHGDSGGRRTGTTSSMSATSTSDHYSDRIARTTTPGKPPRHTAARWEFDSVGLARTIAAERRRLAMSTRELSRRSGVSQPYVIALERARSSADRCGPNPTVDVIARLAHALGSNPQRLFTAALRPIGQHALLVVEDHQRTALEHVQRVTGESVNCWISATSADARRPVGTAGIQVSYGRRYWRFPYRFSTLW